MDQPTTQPIAFEKPEPKKAKTHAGRIIGYAVTVVIHMILIYVAKNVLSWDVSFVTQRWNEVVGIVIASFALNIIAYGSFIIYDGLMYYFIMRTVMDIMGLIVSYRLVTVFPFDFDQLHSWGWLNGLFPVLLWLGIVGIIIGLIVRTARMGSGKSIYS